MNAELHKKRRLNDEESGKSQSQSGESQSKSGESKSGRASESPSGDESNESQNSVSSETKSHNKNNNTKSKKRGIERRCTKLIAKKRGRSEHKAHCNYKKESIAGLCVLIGLLGVSGGSGLQGAGIHSRCMFIFIYILCFLYLN